MNEGHHGIDGQRNDRRHFPLSESRKAPRHPDRRRSVLANTVRPAVPPALTHYSTLLEDEM